MSTKIPVYRTTGWLPRSCTATQRHGCLSRCVSLCVTAPACDHRHPPAEKHSPCTTSRPTHRESWRGPGQLRWGRKPTLDELVYVPIIYLDQPTTNNHVSIVLSQITHFPALWNFGDVILKSSSHFLKNKNSIVCSWSYAKRRPVEWVLGNIFSRMNTLWILISYYLTDWPQTTW